jgi:hypothetical protein
MHHRVVVHDEDPGFPQALFTAPVDGELLSKD